MSRLFFLLVCFLFCFRIYSQDVYVSDDLNIRNSYFYDILGDIDNKYVLIHDDNDDILLDVYNIDMSHNKQMTLLSLANKSKIVGISPLVDKFNLIYNSTVDRLDYINIHQYNNRGILVDSITTSFNVRSTKNIRYTSSKSNRTSVVFSISTTGLVNLIVIGNDSLSVYWKKQIQLDRNLRSTFLSLIVNDNGDVSILSSTAKKLFSTFTNSYKLYLLGSEYYSSIKIPGSENKVFSKISFFYNELNTGLIEIYGLYGERKKSYKGLFNLDINIKTLLFSTNDEDIEFKLTPFTKDIFEEFYNKSKNKFDYIDDLSIRNIVAREDGGVVIVAEVIQSFTRKIPNRRVYYNQDDNSAMKDYNHKEILTLAYFPNSELHWFNVLHKNQFTQDENLVYSSFYTFLNTETISFIFSDNIKSDATVTSYNVNSLGSIDRSTVVNMRNRQLKLRFMDAIQISYKDILVPSQVGNTINLVKFTF